MRSTPISRLNAEKSGPFHGPLIHSISVFLLSPDPVSNVESQGHQRHIGHQYKSARQQVKEGIRQEAVEQFKYGISLSLNCKEIVGAGIKPRKSHSHVDQKYHEGYDQYGEQWRQAEQFQGFGGGAGGAGGGNPFGGFDFSGFGGGAGGFSDFFESLFGRKGQQGGGFGGFQGFGGTSARTHSGEMNATVTIDFYTAMLGGEVILSLSNGQKVKMKVKPETQPGTKVRLRGKGYDRGDGTFGDLVITYQVKLPTNLTEQQKQLLRQMQAAR